MRYLAPAITIVLGLAVGSFLANYIYRYLNGGTAWKGRSKCPDCGKELGAADLVPVFSYLWLRGRCRHCGKPISPQYLMVELATVTLFLGVWLLIAPVDSLDRLFSLLWLWYLAAAAVVITVVDMKKQIIPDKVVLPVIAVTLVYLSYAWGAGVIDGQAFFLHIIMGLGAGGAFFALILMSGGRWVGGGDVKLLALIGLALGWPLALVGILLALWSGAAVSIVLMVLEKKKMTSQIAFGPFLIAGAVVAVAWGDWLLTQYMRLI